jgi:serine/threonine-protein kinase
MLLGEFRIEGILGWGGMGEVYRAFHTSLKQPVALKVLAPALLETA